MTKKDDKSDGKELVENLMLEKGRDLGGAEVQDKMDAEQEQGFRGANVDPTPDQNYTVAGVTANKPTPETDAKAAAEAGSGKFRDVGSKAEPAEMVKMRNTDGHEINVSPKLRSNYPGYKEVK